MNKRRTRRNRQRTGINTHMPRSLNHETLEKRELLAFDLVGVSADVGEAFNLDGVTQLDQSPSEITFRFEGDTGVDPAALSSFSFTASGGDGTFDDGNETTLDPESLGFGVDNQTIVAQFNDLLPNDTFRINVPEDAAGLTGETVDFQLNRVPRFSGVELGAVVRLSADESLPFIEFSLDNLGVEIDADSVTGAGVRLRENGRPIFQSTDYTFEFSETDNTVRLTSIDDGFRNDAVYVVLLRDTILDTAGNSALPAGAVSVTALTIIPAQVPLDFGDAPESFGTLFDDNGPLHSQLPNGNITLGASVDAEFDAVPSASADSDDNTGDDDEDGVAIGIIQQAGRDFFVFGNPGSDGIVPDANVEGVLVSGEATTINVVASAEGFLDAWIDFDRDGVFGATDRIAISFPVVAGNNLLTINTPAGLPAPFETFARFRVSNNGNLEATGLAISGEVEDYQISVAASNFNLPTNTAPTFDILASPVLVGESQAAGVRSIPNFLQNLVPADPGNPVEILTQSIDSITVSNVVSESGLLIPGSLSIVNPGTDANGFSSETSADLIFELAPGLVGQITFDVTVTDSEGLSSAPVNVTLDIQPVNDPPQFRTILDVPVSDQRSPDDGYSVARIDDNGDGQIDDATITYTFREDNTEPLGTTGGPILIPLVTGSATGFNRIGLLDVFEAGPSNETAAGVPGGNQVISFLEAGSDPRDGNPLRRTDLGGTLTPVLGAGGEVIGLNYQPPLDFNSDFGQLDSFTYTVVDDNPLGGESFDQATGAIGPDPRQSTNTVNLLLTPVNDQPEFTTASLQVDGPEDGLTVFENYITAIAAGPQGTAFDENSGATQQNLDFTLVSLDLSDVEAAEAFRVYPRIDPDTRQLTFQPAENVFGSFRFEVTLNDDGPQNSTRGDLISSTPVTLTINVLAVNDPPMLVADSDPIRLVIQEDQTAEILLNGDGTEVGLLDVFTPGPANGFGNEAVDIAPSPGGNQTVSLRTPISNTSTQGGTIRLDESGAQPRLIYQPPPNFAGTDTFIYSVVDDGQTVDANGVAQDDFRTSTNTVTVEVTPVNDAPSFNGISDVTASEQPILNTITIEDWAVAVQAGPATATDEVVTDANNAAQNAQFVFTQISGDTALFSVPPTAIIDPDTQTADLTFQTTAFASGVAVFEVVLEDDGPSDVAAGDEFQSTPIRTFTVTINPFNNPPEVTVVNPVVQVQEDQGAVSLLQVDPISPGPAGDTDEQSQSVSFIVQPLAPQFADLFAVQPTINDSGFLNFTTAPNQNTVAIGSVPLVVTAQDDGGTDFDSVDSVTFTFDIAISEVADAPQAVADPDIDDMTVPFATNEDTVLTLTSDELISNDIDPDLDTNPTEVLQVDLPPSFQSANGASVQYDAETGLITYDPSTSATLNALMNDGTTAGTLTDSFLYAVIDSTGNRSNTASVSIVVTGVNDAPVLNIDSPNLSATGPTVLTPLDNDFDVDGTIDPASVQITLEPSFGLLQVQADGSIIYTPLGDLGRADSFRYSVADNFGLRSADQLVAIPANVRPIAVDDNQFIFRNETSFIDVSANDTVENNDLDLTGITIVRPPNNGQAIEQADGTIFYSPDTGFVGVDTFDYQIPGGNGQLSNVATVRIEVTASRLQNPDQFNDVNADGLVTAIDALLIVNHLGRSGTANIQVTINDQGPNFFDTNGDLTITTLDALLVTQELEESNNILGPEAEQVFFAAVDSDADRGFVSLAESPEVINTVDDEKLADFSSPSAQIEAAIDSIASEWSSKDSQSNSLAIDQVLTGLF